jgi:dTDP-4-amino-4,6-dideoxygalactose transaminase
MTSSIPFNRPFATETSISYLQAAIQGMHLSGDGPFTGRCHRLLEELTGCQHALLTTSCTHALEMAAILLDIAPGDEVIVPSFTFVSTINAFVLHGARPVFCDIRPDTLNMDEALLEQLITSRTRVIVPVHYAGIGCEMDAIVEIAERHGVSIVEDNAHGLLGSYRHRPLGSFGRLATLSFHETKNFSCGEGGALLINDARLAERAEIIREKGTNRSGFFRGQVDKYTWVDVGSSYLPSDLLAAFLYAQLEMHATIQKRRRVIWNRYAEGLSDWAADQGVALPFVPPHCEQAYHMFYLILPSLEQRQEFIAALKQQGIGSAFHYLPLHSSEMGQRFGGQPGDCPVTEAISDRLVRLPFFNNIREDEIDRVIEAVRAFATHSRVVGKHG